MARGDAVIANSHFTAGLIRSLYPQASERVRVIHRGTDLSVFALGGRAGAGRGPAQAWGVGPHERVVLLAARLTGWKGQKVLIEAAAQLRVGADRRRLRARRAIPRAATAMCATSTS